MNNNMNNNRGNNNNNNRRRGRGNNSRQQGGGSAQQLNRIDSRARGNAPQMLEKYRKLAHDAHLNGDRVQEESFLQYADHYFRVIADQRARQDEQRSPRQPGERWQEGSEREESGDGGEYASDNEYQPYDRQNYNRPEREERPRDERPRDERPREERPRDERPRDERPRDERPREERPRENRGRDYRPVEEQAESSADAGEGNASADEAVTSFEPPENPFVREAHAPRGLRPRREDRAPRTPRPAQDDSDGFEGRGGDNGPGLDPSILPPPISIQRDDSAGDDADAERKVSTAADETDAPAPRRRTRRPRPPVDDAGEVIETAS